MHTISNFTFSPISAAPGLSASYSDTQINLAWPAGPLNYIVEFTTNLSSPAVWNSVSQSPVAAGNQWTISLPINATNTFFRLRAQ